MLSRAGPRQGWHEKNVAGTKEIWPSRCSGVFWSWQCCKLFYCLSICISSGTDLCILINTSVKKKPGWRIFESTAVGITLSFTANTAHSYASIVYCISIILFLQEDTAQCRFFDLLFSFSHQLWCWWKMSPYLRHGLCVLAISPYRNILDHQTRTVQPYSFSQRGKGVWFHLIVPLFPRICRVPLLSWEEWSLRYGLLSVQVVLPWADAPLLRTWQWRCVEDADKTGDSLVTEIPAMLCPYRTD